ncbi:glycosyltransferase family 4 protein [Serratia fonticola]|uniref:glycosyltransferase family 4 protein n=1 Tax=Serratia fonticola TaxID=47917 RepID=UPI001378AC18|nr:glycosyltransferase family 4 protein [Serratia fonticola]NCG54147.1 glycosyltransferase [Serratia fonticola]
MRIMLFNTLYYPFQVGGAEISVQLLAEELVKNGKKVRVITLTDESKRKETIINGVEVVYLPLLNIYWPFDNKKHTKIARLFWHLLDNYNFLMYFKVKKEIENFKPDVVHTNNLAGFSVAVWDAVKAKGIKLLHTTRDYYLFHPNCTLFHNGMNMSGGEFNSRVWGAVKKRKSKKVDIAIGISEYISQKHKLGEYFKGARFSFIYNPVNVIPYIKKRSDKIRVGFIGRLTVEKGFDDFCKLALSYINNNKYEFLAAGRFINDTAGDELTKKAQEAGIELLGFIGVKDFLENTDVIFLPIKWNEPFGRTVIEGFLSEKLIITSNVGAISELSVLLPNIIVVGECVDMEKLIEREVEPVTDKYKELFSAKKLTVQYLDLYK